MAAIAEIVARLIVGPATELGKCFAEPIKRQFNYLCCLHSNIAELREESRELKDARDGLQMRVNTAKNNAEEILPEVDTWLEKANQSQVNMIGLESDITTMQSGCLAFKSRFSLSKEVKKTTEAIEDLRGGCNFDIISQPAPPVATALIPLGSTYEFESRKSIEEDIMISLRDEKVNMIGICGMGGVGKTTMVKRVMNRAKEEDLFEETVMAVVSQNIDMLQIQDEIAEQLGLKLEEKILSSRAHKLRTRLTGGKRIFIILDDIWKNFKLGDLGIPCEIGLQGCKVLLTSRDKRVLNKMDAQKVCEIQTLHEVEAWCLFKEKVGTSADDQNLHSIGQEIVKECKGLPIALVTVGVVLKDQEDKSIWKGVLDQLKSSNPEDVPDIIAEVYNPLKLSYDFLDSQHAKSIFLLCCLFPEDYDIPLEYLTVYAIGLRMFERNMNLERAINNTCLVVEMLKSRFLLLEGRDKYYVRMHDIVRDVAIFIASKKMRINCSDCTWFSPFVGEEIELSIGSSSPNLRLLLINESMEVNDNFFEGMTKLNVLFVEYYSLRSLPHSTQLLKDLRTLILQSCESLESMSVVGELVNLEILICHDCVSIEELPAEIGRLDRLRFLEFSDCWNLKTIGPGIISKLIGLEGLKMVQSFDKWEAKNNKGKQGKNVGLRELESLSNLTYLEIEVKDSTLATEQIYLSQKIVKFDITIGDCQCGIIKYARRSENKMDLHLPREITLGNWIVKFLSSSECMMLVGEGVSNLELRRIPQNLRWLILGECSTVKKLVKITSSTDDGRCRNTTAANVFPLLEYLELYNLDNLEEICDTDGSILDEGSRSYIAFQSPYQNVVSPFNNLSSIKIEECHSLRNLFSMAMANDCLSQLERLQIWNCKMIEQIFLWNEEGENRQDFGQESHHITIIFPKLEELELDGLPNLTTFCKGIESIEFPLLTQMKIEYCPKLKSFVSSTTTSSECGSIQNNSGGITNDHDNDISLHLFCEPDKVAFDSLKEVAIGGYEKSSSNILILWCDQISINFCNGLEVLQIYNCSNIRSLFSSSMARNLVNLRKLSIIYCLEMVKVIEDEEEKYSHVCGRGMTCLFPMLQYLSLDKLPKLKIFCEWRCALELPSLKDVWTEDCPEMDRFSLGSLTTTKLETICFRVEENQSFYKWEATLKGIRTMSEVFGDEFRRKTNLLIPEELELKSFPSNIGKYDITIGDPRDFRDSLVWFDKIMHLHLQEEITLGNCIHQCVRSADYMLLEGEGSNNLDLGQAQNMRLLIFRDCSTVKKLVNRTTSSIADGRCGTTTVFPLLQFLKLENLPKLEEVCDIDGPIRDGGSTSSIAFKNLKQLILLRLPELKHLWKRSPYQNNVVSPFSNLSFVEIRQCDNLHNLFSLSIAANDHLLQLKNLEINDCKMMEHVFSWNEEEENKWDIGHESSHITVFPKLEKLRLLCLPRVKTFCKGIESIEFPLLTEMEIKDCPQLKSFASSISTGKNQGVASPFSYLSSIYINGCHSLHNLSSLAMINDCLSQLRRLQIRDCKMMEQIFLWKEEDKNKKHIGQESESIIVFPELKSLTLEELPNLTTFCKRIESIEFPRLIDMRICNCPQLKTLISSTTSSSRSASNQNSSGGINHADDGSLHRFCKLGKLCISLSAYFSTIICNINYCIFTTLTIRILNYFLRISKIHPSISLDSIETYRTGLAMLKLIATCVRV